jgi:hypothetical protein
MVGQRRLQKKRPKIEKRKQQGERKETGRRYRKEDTKGMPRKEQVAISTGNIDSVGHSSQKGSINSFELKTY